MISKNAKIWIWISLALGFNNKKVKSLYELYPEISVFASRGMSEWRFSGLFKENELNRLSGTDIRLAEKIIGDCAALGYSVVSIDDPSYPQCLREIYSPPAVLYIDGVLPDIDKRLAIGIVGTRSASKYGTNNSFKFGYALARYGVCVVSGGAVGVDCASHYGVLSAGGVTVCVLGCGINYPYLRENAGMRKGIARKGAVITEYPPGTPPRAHHFPARNRIIAALSDGVLIIESGERSGSLITADLALEDGKELFALMGNNDPRNVGSNRRIKEGTAIPVTDFMDILCSFENLYLTPDGEDDEWGGSAVLFEEDSPAVRAYRRISLDAENALKSLDFAIPVKIGRSTGSRNKPEIKKQKTTQKDSGKKPENKKSVPEKNPAHNNAENLTGDVKAVYLALTDTPVHIDTLSERLKMPVFKLLPSLTVLQMQGLAREEQGRRFRLS